MQTEIKDVSQANESFYRAFESLTISEMDRVWKHSEEVRCIHPGWESLSGWKLVRSSWEYIFKGTKFMKFDILNASVAMHDRIAWVVCMESICSKQRGLYLESNILATNLFEKCDGRWLMIHHHGSPVYGRPGFMNPPDSLH